MFVALLKSFFLFAFLLIFYFDVYSQEGYTPYNPGSCPPGITCRGSAGDPYELGPYPTAGEYANYNFPSKLESFGDNQVDLYSGTPSISIPLYTIPCRDYALPISLNYDASGIKASQEASWVGLGWTLSAGSPITRIVRGGDDFITSYNGTDKPSNYISLISVNSGYVKNSSDPCATSYMGEGGVNVIPYLLEENVEKDLQTDIFQVNIAGRTIKFILDPSREPNRQVYLLTKEKIRIKLLYTINHRVPSFEITTEDGTRYYYGEVPITSGVLQTHDYYLYTNNYTEIVKVINRKWIDGASYLDQECVDGYMEGRANTYEQHVAGCWRENDYYIYDSSKYATSWNLRKIITSLGDEITFSYTKHSIDYTFNDNYIHIYNNYSSLQNQLPDKSPVIETTTERFINRLSDIIFPLGKVKFVKSINRADVDDVYGSEKDPLLDQLEVYNTYYPNEKLVKKVAFHYTYFNSPNSSEMMLRLKLNSVNEVNVKTGFAKPPYTFIYNESKSITYGSEEYTLPHKHSANKDHWGYYNNLSSVNHSYGFMPTKEQVNVNGQLINFQGAVRDVNVNVTQAGTLTKITYPTGGFTEYTYENNDYYSPSNDQKVVGGLRIKQIRVSDGVNTSKDMYTVYKYRMNDISGNPTNVSSGVLMEDVMYTRVPATSTSGWPVYRSYNNILPAGTHSNGNIVGYSEVTILSGLNGELGKTIYKFHAYPNYYYDNLTPADFTPNAYYQFVYDNIHQRTPGFAAETSIKKKYLYVLNGLLKSSKSFKKSGSNFIAVSEVESFYNEFDNSIISNADLMPNVSLKGVVGTSQALCCTYPNYNCSIYSPNYTIVYSLDPVEILSYSTPRLKLKQTRLKEYIYDQISQARKFIKETTFEYANDDHYQLTKICYNDPNNPDEITCTENFYPADYKDFGNEILRTMSLEGPPYYYYRHIHSPIVESITKRKEAGEFKIVGATVNHFKFANAAQPATSPIILDQTHVLETTAPLIEGTVNNYNWPGYFTKSRTLTNSYVFNTDNDYSTYKFKNNTSSPNGNVTEVLNQIGQPSSVIYGYNNNLTIAKVTNAFRSQISYTGFESGPSPDDDGWGIASGVLVDAQVSGNKQFVHSGRFSVKVPNMTSSIVFGPTKDITPSPQTGKYKISCFIKTNANNSAWLQVYTRQGSSFDPYPTIPAASISVPLLNTNGSWQYYEAIIDLDAVRQSISSPPTLSIRCYVANGDPLNPVYVDEMRVHPVDAEMTTFTYEPLVGPTSVSDINSNSLFTEYDGFQRVKLTRDQDGNILKRFNYFYKQ